MLRLFSHAERHVLFRRGTPVQVFHPQLADLQKRALELLDAPVQAFRAAPPACSWPRLRANPTALFAIALLVIAGVALNRFNATLTAQRVPEEASYSAHWMELTIQVGVLAAGVLAWYVAARLLPVLPGRLAAAQNGEVNRPHSVLPDRPATETDCSSSRPAS